MKTEDFRIGNWVYNSNGEICSVLTIHPNHISIVKHLISSGDMVNVNSLSPIYLNDDWYTRFGFKQWDEHDALHGMWYIGIDESNGQGVMKYVYVEEFDRGGMVYLRYRDEWMEVGMIQYVHELQNIVYCLMRGMELQYISYDIIEE